MRRNLPACAADSLPAGTRPGLTAACGLRPHVRRVAAGSVAAVTSALTGLLLQSATGYAETLRGDDILKLVPGATVHIDTPLGTTLPMTFGEDGSLSGDAGRLAFYLGSRQDRGRWWVNGDRLCQKWSRWFEAQASCLELKSAGNKFHWRRNDGKTGTASIVPRQDPLIANAEATLPNPRALGGPRRDETAPTTSAETRLVPPRVPPPAPAVAARQTAPQQPAPKITLQPPLHASLAPPNPLRRTAPQSRPESGMPGTRPETPSTPPVEARRASPQPSREAWAPTVRDRQRTPLVMSYHVANVRDDDVLNIRVGPSDRAPILATIPPDGEGIHMVGQCVGYWCPIRYRATQGWVHNAYLALSPFDSRRRTVQR